MNSIEIYDGLFLTSDYCVWYEKENVVLLSDLHLGYESVLREDGISLPTFQKENILNRLANIKNRYDPDSFIVLGDFKHDFGKADSQVFNELLDVIDYLMEDSSLVMIKGNHDNFLENYTNLKGVPLNEEMMVLEDLTLTHGHRNVSGEGLLIMGHEHPAIEIKDEVGSTLKYSCFLHHPEHKILVLPAIDPLSEGRDVIASKSFFSKNLDHLNSDDFHVYAISEYGLLDFHQIKDLRKIQPHFGSSTW